MTMKSTRFVVLLEQSDSDKLTKLSEISDLSRGHIIRQAIRGLYEEQIGEAHSELQAPMAQGKPVLERDDF